MDCIRRGLPGHHVSFKIKQLKRVNYVHSTLRMKIKKIKLPKTKATFTLRSIEYIVLKQGGGFPFWLGLFRHMWTQQSHSDVEQNNWAPTAFKRWSNLDFITTLEWLICSENTTALIIGTNSHTCRLVTGAKRSCVNMDSTISSPYVLLSSCSAHHLLTFLETSLFLCVVSNICEMCWGECAVPQCKARPASGSGRTSLCAFALFIIML